MRLRGLILFALFALGVVLFASREGHLKISPSTAEAGKEAKTQSAPVGIATSAPSPSPAVSPSFAPVPSASPKGALNSKPSVEQLRVYLDKTLRELPRRTAVKGLKAHDLHSTPVPVREAAIHLGSVGDLLQKNPEFKAEGLDFYRKCSLDPEGLTPVRAVCLNRALRLHAELHHALWDFDGQKIPKRVLSLAKRL